MVTVSDTTANADLFRRAYPGWPHAAPASQGGTTMTTYQRCKRHPHVIPEAEGCPACALHQQRLQLAREGHPAVQDGPYAYIQQDGYMAGEGAAGRVVLLPSAADAAEDAPDVKVWTRKLSTGARTYRMVPTAELDAYLADIGADPDREVAADAPGGR